MTGLTYQPTHDCGVLLVCTFASGSTGSGCIVGVAGQKEVEIERHGLNGSKTVTLSPGEHELSVYDWDNSEKFGPVLVKHLSVASCDVGK